MTTTTETSPSPWGHVSTGAKYETGRYISSKEIAANVRAEVKAAIKAGTLVLPEGVTKVSVTSETFSMGQAVRITLVTPDENAVRIPVPETDPYWFPGLTQTRPEIGAAAQVVRDMAEAYTRSDIDSQTDYYNVSCYVTVTTSGGSMI